MLSARLRGDDEERAGMTRVGIGGARSDANEANDMQKPVFAYLSRRALHLCKPGMTRKEREDDPGAGSGEGGMTKNGVETISAQVFVLIREDFFYICPRLAQVAPH